MHSIIQQLLAITGLLIWYGQMKGKKKKTRTAKKAAPRKPLMEVKG
ncbi:MAG: hypothetical protein AAF696_20750 [Bacteroidota bacterium]